MTALAWILISCEPGRERDVYLQLLDMPVVSEVSVVYGELDLVARIDFESEKEMSRTLIEDMRHVEGIRKTETLIAVEVLAMAVGFVLITTEPGKEISVREKVADIDCVKGIWVVFGSFDCFVKVEADEESDLTEAIVQGIRSVPGIIDTRTLIGAEI